MSENHNKYDFLPDPAAALSGAEEGMARRLEEDNVLEYREEEVREAAHKKLWTQFQQTAAALTQLYRDQAGREGLAWQPFQAAAGSLTLLYRDSLEELRLTADINRKLGYQRARRDILTWARSKRRSIRRDELLSLLVQSSPGQSVSAAELPWEGGLVARLDQRPPTLQDMLEISRLDSPRAKRPAPPSSPSHDEHMDSPASKRSRFN